MRVLAVTNMYPTGAQPDSGTFVADQVRSLRDLDVEVDVTFADRDRLGRRAYLQLARRINGLVARSQPDLVHVMYGGVMADVVTRAVDDRPVVVTFHGDDLQGNAGNGPLAALAGRYSIFASTRAARRAAGIVVVSPKLRERLARSVDASSVWLLPNGVDLARFIPRERTECQEIVGWDTRRAHVLFGAPPARREKRYDLARAVVEMVRRGGTEVELHTLEGIPHDHVPIWLNAANALLLTSLREGSPMVVKEALACDVAVVSVDVGDVRQRIEGIEGCFLAASTREDLADKLARALARTERIEGRERVAELALERVAERLREIYALLTTAR